MILNKLRVTFSWIGLGYLCALSSGCLDTSCSYTVLKQETSPDSKYVATVFESNCGATAPFVQHVLLREASESFDGEKVDNVVFIVRGRSVVDVRWLGTQRIVIRRVPNHDDIFKEEESFRGITISYVSDWPASDISPTDTSVDRSRDVGPPS